MDYTRMASITLHNIPFLTFSHKIILFSLTMLLFYTERQLLRHRQNILPIKTKFLIRKKVCCATLVSIKTTQFPWEEKLYKVVYGYA